MRIPGLALLLGPLLGAGLVLSSGAVCAQEPVPPAPPVRTPAGEGLEAPGHTASGAALIEEGLARLQDGDPAVRREGVELLVAAIRTGEVQPALAALEPLGRALEDPDERVQLASLEALRAYSRSRSAEVWQALRKAALEDASEMARAAAVRALGMLPGSEPGEAEAGVLLQAARDPAVRVRQASLEAYGARFANGWRSRWNPTPAERAGRRRWVALLVEALRDPAEPIRETAARQLAFMQADPDLVVPALAGALQDPAPSVRRAAAEALRSHGARARPARPALSAALREAEGAGGGPSTALLQDALDSVRLPLEPWVWTWVALLPFVAAGVPLRQARGAARTPLQRVNTGLVLLVLGPPLGFALFALGSKLDVLFRSWSSLLTVAASAPELWVCAAVTLGLLLAAAWLFSPLVLWPALGGLAAAAPTSFEARRLGFDSRDRDGLALLLFAVTTILVPALLCARLAGRARRELAPGAAGRTWASFGRVLGWLGVLVGLAAAFLGWVLPHLPFVR